MPWKGQPCPFCHIKYANKKGLRDHLLKYAGRWRLPADGIHDVLKIQSLRVMNGYFEKTDKVSYRCPICDNVFGVRRRFIEHVIHYQHYDSYGKAISSSLKLPFHPEHYKIWRPKGMFPFLRLAPGKLVSASLMKGLIYSD